MPLTPIYERTPQVAEAHTQEQVRESQSTRPTVLLITLLSQMIQGIAGQVAVWEKKATGES